MIIRCFCDNQMFLFCCDKKADTIELNKLELPVFIENIFKEFDMKKIELWRWEGWGLDQLRQTTRVEH